MTQRNIEIAVGATVLLALGLLIGGIYWLRDMSSGRDVRVWHVTFPQTGGLGKSDEVQVNGVRKGMVNEVHLQGDQVVVDLALSKEVILTSDSRVAIRNVGLMGEKVIGVDLKLTGIPYSQADTIRGIYELGMGEVMASLGGTVESVNALAAELQSVTASMTKDGRLTETIRNFQQTSEQLRILVTENRQELTSTLENFEAASRTARSLTTDREAELRKTLDQFTLAANNMAVLSTRLDSLRNSIQTITTKVERGEGTLGKLVSDEKLYTDVKGSVQSLQLLIEDIKKNPRRYIKLSIF